MEKDLKDVAMELDDGKLYTPVHERIKYFNDNYPEGGIETQILSQIDKDRIVVKALVTPDWKENPQRRFTGHASGTFDPEDKYMATALEVIETSAIGRALGAMGIGIIGGMASANEIAKAEKMRGKGKKNTKQQEEKSSDGDDPDEVESIKTSINACEKVEDLREMKQLIKDSGLSRETIKELGDIYNAKMKELKNA